MDARAAPEDLDDLRDLPGELLGDDALPRLVADPADEVGQLVPDAVALELVEVAAVVPRILLADLEVVHLPPRRRGVDVPPGAGHDEVALGLDAAPGLEGRLGARVPHDDLRVLVDARGLVERGDEGQA